MKKVINLGLFLLITGFQVNVYAQGLVNNLMENCTIFPDAKWILSNCDKSYPPLLTMGEYGKSTNSDGPSFKIEVLAIYEWDKSYIPRSSIASAVWTLVSEQVKGGDRVLSKTNGNFIPTMDQHGQPTLLLIAWIEKRNQWAIMSIPISTVKAPRQGTRIFLKSL